MLEHEQTDMYKYQFENVLFYHFNQLNRHILFKIFATGPTMVANIISVINISRI